MEEQTGVRLQVPDNADFRPSQLLAEGPNGLWGAEYSFRIGMEEATGTTIATRTIALKKILRSEGETNARAFAGLEFGIRAALIKVEVSNTNRRSGIRQKIVQNLLGQSVR